MSEPPGTDDPGQGPEEQVGSVSEEAAKLFGAFSEWARDQGAGVGEGLFDLGAHADRAARVAHEVDEHLATGSAACTYCPLCRAVGAVRSTSPEVRAHLASAASSLLHAAAGALATAVPPGQRAPGRGPGVEHIDLGTDDGETAPDDDGARPEEDA